MKAVRRLGDKLPLSIGTAIPFEEVIVTDKPKSKMLFVSLRTLFRNYLTAFTKDDRYTLEQVVNEFQDELDLIDGYCKIGGVSLTIYYCRLKRISREYPALVQPDNWEANIGFDGIFEKVLPRLNTGYVSFDVGHPLPDRGFDEYLMTSYPVELLTLGWSTNTKLLESHTGSLKSPHEWITKLTSNKKYHVLPFNRLTYQLLGDKSVTSKGGSIRHKKMLVEIATANRWVPTVSLAKCVRAIKKSNLPDEDKRIILSYAQ